MAVHGRHVETVLGGGWTGAGKTVSDILPWVCKRFYPLFLCISGINEGYV